MIFHTENRALIVRAMRAALSKKRVLLLDGEFVNVRYVVPNGDGSKACIAYDVVGIARRRKSLDDCTPVEWDAASRAVRKTY